MTDNKKNDKPFSSFIFRFPRIPFNRLATILDDNDSLFNTLSTPFFRSAIYAASPVLYDELQKVLNKKSLRKKTLNE